MAKRRGWLSYGLVVVMVLFFALPLYWVFVAALGPTGGPPPTTIPWWPPSPQWDNYRALFNVVPFARQMGNSLLVVAITVPVTIVVAGLAGFGLSQLPTRERRQILYLSIGLLIVPAAAVWMFRYQILSIFQMVDTLWALVIPAFAGSNPIFVLLYYWAFRQIPAELFEAARLEGAEAFTLWRTLAMPLAIPTTVSVAVLTFALYWSDFVTPLLFIYDPTLYTLPMGLALLNQLDNTNWPLLMAGAVVMTAPIIILVALLQRLFLHEFALSELYRS